MSWHVAVVWVIHTFTTAHVFLLSPAPESLATLSSVRDLVSTSLKLKDVGSLEV